MDNCSYCMGKGCENCMSNGGRVDKGLSDDEKRKARSERHPVSLSGGPGRQESRHGHPDRNQRGTSLTWSKGKSLGHHEDEVFKSGTKARKSEAKDNLSDLKQLPKPKLEGLAHGGKVKGTDMNGSQSKSFMDKGEFAVGHSTKAPMPMAEGGEMDAAGEMDEDMDNEMLDMCCDELLQALESKNKKEILESLKAIILSVKG